MLALATEGHFAIIFPEISSFSAACNPVPFQNHNDQYKSRRELGFPPSAGRQRAVQFSSSIAWFLQIISLPAHTMEG
jgi:6-phosphogluconolactonase/glucosamine-6-phosphate isomerase/deaminase